MITFKICENDAVFKNTEDAINYMHETNFERDIMMYDISSEKAYEKILKVYDEIVDYNKGKPLDDQILPSNPQAYRGILGCLGVCIYAITLGTYKSNHECIALFAGFNESVLDTSIEKADVRPGLKALSSLAMILAE